MSTDKRFRDALHNSFRAGKLTKAQLDTGLKELNAGGLPIEINMPSAPGILHSAASIMEERGKQYDQKNGERSMGKAVDAFNVITGRDLQESEGWLLLQVLKDVRDRTTKAPHADSLEDCVAYAALKAEARMQGK